jgi:hypothetical protein
MSAATLPTQQLQQALNSHNDARQQLITAGFAEPAKPRDIEELCEQFAPVCESAVDSLEISSALEFDGLNDQAVRKRYGVSDVFALAEEMYRRVPRRPAEPEPLPDPWRVSKLRPALHGLLYALPTICFPAAAGLLTGPGVRSILVVALLVSWALSQAVAYLGYVRLGRAGPAQAARLLQFGVVTGMVGVVLALAITALAASAHIPVVIFGVGLGAYMLGATVLMVLGAERLLLAALAPSVVGAAVFLALGRPPHLEYAAWGALAATPLLALGLAAARTREDAGFPRSRRGRHARTAQATGKLLGPGELRSALPSAGFGLFAAGLVVFPIAAGVPGHGGTDTGALLASLPLALSMGAAEWMLVWFRRRTQRLLRRTRQPEAFNVRAWLVLFAALLCYLTVAVLLTLTVIAVAILTRLSHPHWTVLPQVMAYMALGGSMFLALLLQAFGIRIFPLISCGVALAFEVACRSWGVSGQVVACSELLLAFIAYAALALGNPMRHAC